MRILRPSRTHTCIIFLLLALASSLPSVVYAAPVNADSLTRDPFAEDWSGFVAAAASLAAGNVEFIKLSASGRIQFQTFHNAPGDNQESYQVFIPEQAAAKPDAVPFLKQRVFLNASASYAERSGDIFLNNTYAHLRWTAMWHPRFGTEAFAQYSFNEFLLLEARSLFGGGIRIDLFHSRPFLFWAGAGYMYQYERIDDEDERILQNETFEHRLTGYLAIRFDFFDSALLIQNTVYFQPRIDEFSDFRILEEFEALIRITDYFSAGSTLSVLHDSAPPETVANTDVRLQVGFRISY